MIFPTREDIAALSQDERDLVKALGLDFILHERTRRGRPKCTCGKSYILVTKITCRLCNGTVTRVFEMAKQGSFLCSEELTGIPSKETLRGMSIKHSSYSVRSCGNCKNYLGSLTKEDLILKFLFYIKDGRNFIT